MIKEYNTLSGGRVRVDLLAEFEKRYRGDATQSRAICLKIAQDFDIEHVEVIMYIYVNRYEEESE